MKKTAFIAIFAARVTGCTTTARPQLFVEGTENTVSVNWVHST